MRFQHLLLFLGLFVLSTSAHITGIIPTLKKYHATSSSKYPLTFATTSGLDTYYDFSVVTGVSPASESHPNGIGAFAENFDLMASGHGTTVGYAMSKENKFGIAVHSFLTHYHIVGPWKLYPPSETSF